MKKNEREKVKYQKPMVVAGTKQNQNFSSGCMSGNACCLHCRQN